MGLDMYLTAKKFINGGYSHVRNDYIREEGKPVRIEPKAVLPPEAKMFDKIISALGFGSFATFSKKYPEGNSIEVSVGVAYWRKANAIHQWFVDNVQEGVDDCQEYEVSRDQLRELLDIVTELLKHVDKGAPVKERDVFFGGEYDSYPNLTMDVDAAKASLPTQQGFFFGSTNYDEWYVQDLEITRDQLTQILNDKKLGGFYFSYRSSW